MEAMIHRDLRYALGNLARKPSYAAVAVITLAVGIGTNTALFSALDELVLNPPTGLEDPASLVRLSPGSFVGPATGSSPSFTFPSYFDIESSVAEVVKVAGYSRATVTLAGAETEDAEIVFASGDYFSVLGREPALGRFFVPTEISGSSYDPVAVISHDLWRRKFASDPSVLSQSLRLNGLLFTIIGVAPSGFSGADLGVPDAWLPLGSAAAAEFGGAGRLGPQSYWIQGIGRLRSGVSAKLSQRQVAAATAAAITIRPLRTNFYSENRGQNPLPIWIIGLSLVVLLVACANVAMLLIARTSARSQEVAVRLALGASPGRILRLFAIEGLLITGGATAFALLFAIWTKGFLKVLPIPPLSSAVTSRTIAVAVLLGLLSAAVIMIAPAIWSARSDVQTLLKGRSKVSESPGIRRLLIASQVALSCLLLIVGGLFLRSLYEFDSTDPGFEARQQIVLEPTVVPGGEIGDMSLFDEASLDRIRDLPGVSSATSAFSIPAASTLVLPVATSLEDPAESVSTVGNRIGQQYFTTLDIRIVEGRPFAGDDERSPPVSIVSERFAAIYWPGESPLGKCLYVLPRADPTCRRVVGVAEDAKYRKLVEPHEPVFYVPMTQPIAFRYGTPQILVSVDGDAAAKMEAIRQGVQQLSTGSQRISARPLQEFVDRESIRWRTAFAVIAGMGGLVVLLAAFGVQILLSFVGSQRSREIGIRIALGARKTDITLSLLLDGFRPIATGLAVGSVVALFIARYLAPGLYGVSFADPASYLGSISLLLTTSLLSSLIPALKASSLHPMSALRLD